MATRRALSGVYFTSLEIVFLFKITQKLTKFLFCNFTSTQLQFGCIKTSQIKIPLTKAERKVEGRTLQKYDLLILLDSK